MAAARRAAQLLAAAGVKSSWKLCPPSSLLQSPPSCGETGSLTILVRVLPPADAKAWPVGSASCGLALTGLPGEHGSLAIIDEACITAQSGPVSHLWAALMGHVLAHEIGHLLMGRDSHSPSGLMSARWTKAEQSELLRGELRFTKEDSARLRDGLASRVGTYR